MRKLIFILLFLLLGLSLARAQNTDCIEPYIRERYELDSKVLVRYGVEQDEKYADSLHIPKAETDRLLRMLSAAYRLNDSIFTKLNVHVREDLCYTPITLKVPVTVSWAKALVRSEGKVRGPRLTALMKKYKLEYSSTTSMGDYYLIQMWSPEIWNTTALAKFMNTLPGAKLVNIPTVMEARTTIQYSFREKTITMVWYGLNRKTWKYQELDECTVMEVKW